MDQPDDAPVGDLQLTMFGDRVNDFKPGEQFNAMTVPFLYTQYSIMSANNCTVKEDSPGIFDLIFTISKDIWLALLISMILLMIISILEEKMKGVLPSQPTNTISKLTLQYFGSLLAHGLGESRWVATRTSNGLWLLSTVVFINILSGRMKAQYSAQMKRNFNSIDDVLETPGIEVDIKTDNTAEICKSKLTQFVELCHRANQDYYDTKEKLLSEGKMLWFVEDFILGTRITDALRNRSDTDGPIFREFLSRAHYGSTKYFGFPLAYFLNIYNNNHTEALKLVNKRLRSFFETSQFIPWYRGLELSLKFKFISEPNIVIDTEFQPIPLGSLEIVFQSLIILLSFIFAIALAEIVSDLCLKTAI